MKDSWLQEIAFKGAVAQAQALMATLPLQVSQQSPCETNSCTCKSGPRSIMEDQTATHGHIHLGFVSTSTITAYSQINEVSIIITLDS
eukprot:4395859-Amphidinium_carterae.1